MSGADLLVEDVDGLPAVAVSITRLGPENAELAEAVEDAIRQQFEVRDS